jgi:hypothetical protein
LAECRFDRCILSGAEFSKATLRGVALHGSTLESIRGADALSGAIIGSDQVPTLAPAVFAALGIVVDDDAAQWPGEG